MSFEDCKVLSDRLRNETRSLIHYAPLFIVAFNILPQQPAITEGLLLVLVTHFRSVAEMLKGSDTPYAKKLLSRLEEYHGLHHELEDLSIEIDSSPTNNN